jgi:mono/diheme cytochrome c family protein
MGDCAVCHTAEAGADYAGGLPLPTPFGTIFSTNITPDEATGIGSWSKTAFRRAMREGVSRNGHFLYPAMPYDHYAHVSDQDIDDLYAFLMTRRAIEANAPSNRLIFPLGFRPLLAGWQLLFLHGGRFSPTPAAGDPWNRGAYLAEGLAHCGGCHTPRDLAGGEESERPYAGGVAEGWNAPALDSSNPMAETWTVAALYNYLKAGMDPAHSVAAGPMGPVTAGLSTAPDQDVRAIAVYIASLMHGSREVLPQYSARDRESEAARQHAVGANLFQGACAGCHEAGAPMLTQDRPVLAFITAIQESDPRNTILAILHGLKSPTGPPGPYMPAFGDNLTDREIAEVAAYLRARYSDRPAWAALESAVAGARKASAPP